MIFNYGLRKRLAAALGWSTVDKSLVLLLFAIPLYLQALIWSIYVMSRTDRDLLVDTDMLTIMMQIEILLVFSGAVIALWGLHLRRRKPELRFYQHLVIHFFTWSMILLAYSFGTVSYPAGVILVGAPLFGFILLERRAVWIATMLGLTALIGLSYAATLGWIPYAPILRNDLSAASSLFWLSTTLYFSVPFFIVNVVMIDELLMWWRDREERVKRLAITDGLTGLANRRQILAQFADELQICQRKGQPLSLILLDLDHFKKVNDTHGHPAGDAVLRAAARALQGSIRETDHVGRYGGEEFMVVLPGADRSQAAQIAERCRDQLAVTAVSLPSGKILHFTASLGLLCSAQPQVDAADQLIHAADEALYEAKQSGRNRVAVAGLTAVPV